MRTLEDMEARAKRHLDGMTVNRDAMAKGVLQLVDAIRAVQKHNAEKKAATDGMKWFEDLLKPRGA
mgnify:FL=1